MKSLLFIDFYLQAFVLLDLFSGKYEVSFCVCAYLFVKFQNISRYSVLRELKIQNMGNNQQQLLDIFKDSH